MFPPALISPFVSLLFTACCLAVSFQPWVVGGMWFYCSHVMCLFFHDPPELKRGIPLQLGLLISLHVYREPVQDFLYMHLCCNIHQCLCEFLSAFSIFIIYFAWWFNWITGYPRFYWLLISKPVIQLTAVNLINPCIWPNQQNCLRASFFSFIFVSIQEHLPIYWIKIHL